MFTSLLLALLATVLLLGTTYVAGAVGLVAALFIGLLITIWIDPSHLGRK